MKKKITQDCGIVYWQRKDIESLPREKLLEALYEVVEMVFEMVAEKKRAGSHQQ